MGERSELRWRPVLQLLFGATLTILFFYMMGPFLVPMLLGAITALLCYPLLLKISHRMPRPVAAGLVTLGVSLGILLPVAFLILGAVQELLKLLATLDVATLAAGSTGHIPLVDKVLTLVTDVLPIDRNWVQAQLGLVFTAALQKVSGTLGAFLAAVPGRLLDFFVIVLSVYFFLVDGARFLVFLASLSPMRIDRSRELYRTFESSCRGVVFGLFASAAAQGFLISLFFLLCRIPNALLFGVFGVVMGMVPIVGTAPITLGALLYLFVEQHFGLFIVMAIGTLLVGTVDNVVRPLAMRGKMGMHPMLALVSAFGAVNLLGPAGIFLGPVIAAVFVSFVKILALDAQAPLAPSSVERPQ